MNIRTMAAALLAAATWAAPAWAADTIWGGVTGGIGLPIGNFSDLASTGFSFGATGDYWMNDQWAVGGEISWHGFGGNDKYEKKLSAQIGVPADVTIRVVPVIAHVKYPLPVSGSAHPYIKFGLGLYNVHTETDAGLQSGTDSETKLGFAFGGGMTLRSGPNLAYGADALYHYISTSGESSNLITLRAQVLFGFGVTGSGTPVPTTSP